MEGGSLFNPGFLGASFNWWIGQIVSDSTWRDNILPGKFENKDEVPGWGRRYKVRIIGLHDQGETEIPSDQLPWAQIMYPVTAGGGQANASATANLRQGMMVFGFFLDGQEQQVPVIMGVLGNNIQTELASKIGDSRVTNTQPGSLATAGYATPNDGNKDPFISVPQAGLDVVQKKFPTVESADAIHKQTAADVIREEYYSRKTVLMSPCDKVQSALKAIQTELDNLTRDIDKVLNAANSYIDAVTNLLGSIQSLISDIACKIAKYMKIVFDKIMEYVLKEINKNLSPTVEAVPPNMRYKYFDIKKSVTELITCLYNKITGNLCALIEGLLNQKIDTNPPDIGTRTPGTPMCSVEELAGNLIALNLEEMTNGVNSVLDNVNQFLNDIQSEIGTIGGFVDLIGGVTGSITSALSFENLSLNIFGCDLRPYCPASDYYTIKDGGGGSPQAQLPNVAEVDKSAQQPVTPPTTTETPYAQPSQNQLDVVVEKGVSKINQAADFIRRI